MMYYITRLELYTLRDGLSSVLEEEDYDTEDVREGLIIVEALLDGQEVTVCQEED